MNIPRISITIWWSIMLGIGYDNRSLCISIPFIDIIIDLSKYKHNKLLDICVNL